MNKIILNKLNKKNEQIIKKQVDFHIMKNAFIS